MRQLSNVLSHRKAVGIALTIGVLLGVMFFSLAFYENNRINQQETIKATEHFVVLDNKLNTLVYTNIHLLQGFMAYIQTNDELYDENIYRFLDVLLSSQYEMINNVGILKDTTIIWNYPYEANKASIGVDLATVDAQKEVILKVKNERITLFQGPIDMVQGGKGFIIRHPVIESDGTYWGQVSVVLKHDEFLAEITKYEKELNIKAVILSEGSVIYGDPAQLDKDLYWFTFDDEAFVWDVGIELLDHNGDVLYRMLLFGFLGTIALLAISIASYVSVRANEKVKHESVHDHLTGLRNRYTLEETIDQVFAAANRNGHKVGILLIDLNRFKEINDTHGHTTGDEVLKEVALRLQKASRSDEILFRVGGDEFMLVVPVVNGFGVLHAIKNRIQEHLTFILDVHGYQIKVSASIGCAMYKDDGDNFDILYQVADRRMYDEKHSL
ncbi:MAG: sensor domain-containing diguanylate cyclase [Firmicutes bacterium]|nr:sensor domain-containing diguanylate cyclase [Bacillota bacterium]